MFILNPYTAKPNTIIGGVGSVITTKSALATKLGISESIIRKFEVVGSDVHCRITANYAIKYYAFQSESYTDFKYIDLDGKCTLIGLQTFSNSNITNAYLPNAPVINGSFSGATSLTNADYGGVYIYNGTVIYAISSFRNTRFKILNAPNLTSLNNNNCFQDADIEEIIAPNLAGTVGERAFQNSKIRIFPFNQITGIYYYSFYNCSEVEEINSNSIVALGMYSIRGMSGVVSCWINNVETIANKEYFFQNWSSAELISMKKLKVFGNAAAVSNAFQNIKTGCLIQVHEDLATANAGVADAALVWVKANRGAIVEFYDDAGNYVSTL